MYISRRDPDDDEANVGQDAATGTDDASADEDYTVTVVHNDEWA